MALVDFAELPEGVWPLKDYKSLGATLVECEHAARTPLLYGGDICRVCHSTGSSLDRPVKMLVTLHTRDAQASLF